MDLSKKVLLASCACACAVVLAGVSACSVEDRNLEEKNLFLCNVNADCLDGSQCRPLSVLDDPSIGHREDGTAGYCVREEEIDHCNDYDGDGYYAAEDPKYQQECEYGEIDWDDNDPSIYPGANEACDGKDNSQDGCVDGICSKEDGNCSDDPSLCLRLYRPAVGNYTLSEAIALPEFSVCNPIQFGGSFCVNGKWEFGKYNKSGEFSKNEDVTVGSYDFNGHTIASNDDAKTYLGYVEALKEGVYEDQYDLDCDGILTKQEKCEEIPADSTEHVCFFYKNGKSYSVNVQGGSIKYDTVYENCGRNTENCPCIGTFTCKDSSEDYATAPTHKVGNFDYVCVKGGKVLSENSENFEELKKCAGN